MGLGLIFSLVLIMSLPVSAEGQAAIVRSDPAVLQISAGQTLTLNVVLVDATSVYGIDVSATFDPQLVEVVDGDPALVGAQFNPGSFPRPDFLVRNEADNQAGTLRYVVTQVNPTEPVSGSGIVFSVQLRAKAASGEGSFTITAVDLTDRDGALLAVQPEAGVIRIVSAGQITSTVAAPPSTPTATIPPASDGPTATLTAPSQVLAPTVTEPAPAALLATPPPDSAPTPVATRTPLPALSVEAPTVLVQPPTTTPVVSIALDTATPEQLAAPPVAATATPETVASASTPAADNATVRSPAAPDEPAVDQVLPDVSFRGQGQEEEASMERSSAFEPGQVLLAIAVAAFSIATVLSLLIVVVLRR